MITELQKDDMFAKIAVRDSAVHRLDFMCKQPESDVDTEMAESWTAIFAKISSSCNSEIICAFSFSTATVVNVLLNLIW